MIFSDSSQHSAHRTGHHGGAAWREFQGLFVLFPANRRDGNTEPGLAEVPAGLSRATLH